MRIYSEVGRGTTVKVYLPRHFGSVEEATAPLQPRSIPTAASQSETVLVVEDEDRVRQMSCEALRELGYAVHAASSGEAALRTFNELGRVDVLFTDVVMGGMTGRAACRCAAGEGAWFEGVVHDRLYAERRGA